MVLTFFKYYSKSLLAALSMQFSEINPISLADILVLLPQHYIPKKTSQSSSYISSVEMPGIEHRIPDTTS